MPLRTQAETVVEAVVAVITFEKNTETVRKIIYLSDLERYRLFFETSEDRTSGLQKNTTLDKTHEFTRRRNAVIHQRLFRREALRFAIKKPTEAEVVAALAHTRLRFQDKIDFENALQQSALNLSKLKEEITLYLWVEKLIRERIQEFIFIGPKAIKTYYLNHLDVFVGQRIEVTEKKITEILSREKEVKKKKTYLKRLKEKAQIEFIFSGENALAEPS